jgi:hypothetical protein
VTKRLLTGAVLAAVLLGGAACNDTDTTTTTATPSAATTAAASASASAGTGDHAAACAAIKSSMEKAATDFLSAILAAGSQKDANAMNTAAQKALNAYAKAASDANAMAASDPEVKAALDNLQTVMTKKANDLATIKDQKGLEDALNDPELNKATLQITTLCP